MRSPKYSKVQSDEDSENAFSSDSNLRNGGITKRHIFYASIVQLAMILVYTVVAIHFITVNKEHCAQANLYKAIPEADVLYDRRLWTPFNKSPYAGPPTPESDKAWHDLLGNMSIRVTKKELDRYEQKSVELPSGGYLAWLGTFHEIHCVKMLRQWNYRDHYHPNLTTAEVKHFEVHADHCIDMLRSAAMCHADTSTLTTFKWDVAEKPMLDSKRVPHRCVDWDKLIESVKGRTVSREEVANMKNPHPGHQ